MLLRQCKNIGSVVNKKQFKHLESIISLLYDQNIIDQIIFDRITDATIKLCLFKIVKKTILEPIGLSLGL